MRLRQNIDDITVLALVQTQAEREFGWYRDEPDPNTAQEVYQANETLKLALER